MVNATDPLLFVDYISTFTGPAIKKVSVLVGGVFGLYLILLLIKWWQNRMIIGLLVEIRNDLDLMNKKFKVKNSQRKKLPEWHNRIRKIFMK